MFLDIIFIVILVFAFQYYFIELVKTNTASNITHSLDKIYLSSIYALAVGLIYVLLMDFKKDTKVEYNYYLSLCILIGILIYAYRIQWSVTDYDWANSMIELQSNGILISEKMAEQKPSNDNQIKCIELSKNIVKTQQEQIELLKHLASNSNVKKLF